MARLNPPPRVAVVVPCFNDSAYIADALESVRHQSFSDLECVVVNDGSKDDSEERIQAVVSSDQRFRSITIPTNRGLPAARNLGLNNTEAELIAFLDADDLMLRQSVADRVQALDQHDDYDIAGSYAGVRYDSIEAHRDAWPSAFKTGPDQLVDFVAADAECPFPVHAPLTKRDVILKVGLFDESMTSGAEDWDLWYRILRAGYAFVPATLTSVVYRFKSGGMTGRGAKEHVLAATRLIEAANSEAQVHPESGYPMPLAKPLADYRRQITVAKRGLRFAAMAGFTDGTSEVAAIVKALEVSDWRLVLRHIDIESTVGRAAARVGTAAVEAETSVAASLLEAIEQVETPI